MPESKSLSVYFYVAYSILFLENYLEVLNAKLFLRSISFNSAHKTIGIITRLIAVAPYFSMSNKT